MKNDVLEVKGRALVVVGFFGMAVVMVLAGWLGMAWVERLGVLWWILCLSLMISSLPMVFLGMRKALDKRPLLVVDRDGMHDRVTSPARRFAWNEITGFRLSPANTRKPQVLAIDVADPARAIRDAPLGTRTALEVARQQHGSPCIVWLGALDIDPNQLLTKLRSAQLVHASPPR